MPDATPATDPYIPTGHPVRRFVVGIAVVAVALGALWWSGLGKPRLSVRLLRADPSSAVLVIANDGPTPVELLHAELDDPRLEGETVELPDERLDTGQELEVVVRYASTCTPTPPSAYHLPFEVTARTAVGLERTVEAGTMADIGDLVCDATG